MRHVSLMFLLSAVSLTAQIPTVAPTPAAGPFRSVFIAEAEADGTTWIRGERYKLAIAADAVTFQPLFGPRAPRDFPIHFRLLDATIGGAALQLAVGSDWQRDGEHFRRQRGGLRECWQVTPAGAMQYFEVERPTGDGDLVLRIAATSDLQLADDGPGVRFAADGLGHVHYGDAVVIDARGDRLDVPVVVQDGALVIDVPAAFTATAAWPLVVDPLVTTFALDTTTSDIQDPRVACEPTTGNWLVVAEEHLSATTVDLISWRYSGSATPTLLDTTYIENGADRSNNPGVGFVAATQEFVVAWHNATVGNMQWRRRAAGSTTMFAIVNTSAGLGGNLDCRAMVGSSLTGNRWLLVMFRKNSSGTDILAQLNANTGTGFGSMFVGPITVPSQGTVAPGGVSVASNATDRWVVIWRECTSAACSSQVIRMQAIAGAVSGSLAGQPTLNLATGSLVDEPDVAGHGGNLLATWRTFDGTTNSNDIHGVPIAAVGGTWLPQGAVQNLSAQEPGVNNVREQTRPSVSYDGTRFVYGYLEDNGNDLVFPHAATVFVAGSTITWHEGHLPLSNGTGQSCHTLDLGHGRPTEPCLHMAVWQQDSAVFTGNVHGAVIDARQPGIISVVDQTGCGLPTEPTLALLGTPAIGRTFTLSLTAPGALPFILVGSSSVSALPGCGTCQLGVDQSTMQSFLQSSLSIAVPGSLGMMGLRLSFQGLAGFQTGGCPANVFGLDFALSDTISVQVR